MNIHCKITKYLPVHSVFKPVW